MHIGVDLDNTVLNATTAFLTYFNQASGLTMTSDDVKEFHLYRMYGWDEEQYEKVYAEYGHHIHWHSQPYPNVQEVLRDLFVNHRITIITARPDKFREVTEQWLDHYHIPRHDMVFTENKLQACMDLKVDVLIDDGPHYATEFARDNKPVILMDQPYNRSIESGLVYRASSWVDVKRHIDRLGGQAGEF